MSFLRRVSVYPLYAKLLLEGANRRLQCRLAPQDIAGQRSGPSGIIPIFVHPRMACYVPLLAGQVLVLGVIRIPTLAKGLDNLLAVGLHKYSIPLFLRVVRPLDGFQTQSTHCYS